MDKLEQQTELILKNNNWELLCNAYYKDPITNKPREKDVIATSVRFKDNNYCNYSARLFIECKQFPEETEIFLSDSKINEIDNSIISYNVPFDVISKLEEHKKFNFYSNKNIFRHKDSKDYLYKAVDQNLQSFDAFRKNILESGVYYFGSSPD